MKGIELSVVNEAFNLPPAEAIKFFEAKGYAFTWDWQEQLTLDHRKVFTVAKAMRMDVLQDIRGMLDKAMQEGITFQQFKKELSPRLRAKGWWGKAEVEGKVVQLGSPYRLRTIFQTNLQSSLSAGRWKAFEDNKDDRPYLKYVAVMDGSTTNICINLDGVIKPVDDSFWNINAPPNHWNCRSRLRPFTVTQALRSKAKIPPDVRPDKGFEYNPGRRDWAPEPIRYDQDIWSIGETLPYVALPASYFRGIEQSLTEKEGKNGD